MASKSSAPRRPGRPKNPIAREALLDFAMRAFSERGYNGASMAEIADAAGLRKASLFHHFPSKGALYQEVLTHVTAQLAAMVAEAGLEQGSFLQRLDALGRVATEYFGFHPGSARLLLRELLNEGPFLQAGGHAGVQSVLDGIAAFLQSGMLSDDIASQDPYQLALSLVSLHITYFAVPTTSGELLEVDIHDPGAIAARLEEVLLQVRHLCGART